jgi:hypothetical protein
METILFKDCSRLLLEKKFGLEELPKHEVLEKWLAASATIEINAFENETIIRLQEILNYRVDDWNEIELVEHFIAPLMSLVNFNTHEFGMFSWRTMTAEINNYILTGNPDAIVAKGRREPEIPYFCFHEYKREQENKGEPIGQCLAAMMAAIELNNNQRPMYGVAVKGKLWYFIVLQGKNYSISEPFKSVNKEIYDIVKMLKQVKTTIEAYVKSDK